MQVEGGSFASVLRRAWRDNALFAVLVELTYRCNLDCVFCYNDLGLAGAPMTTPEWVKLFEDLSDMQVLSLTLSGGEPLAHPDFFLLGRKARDLGFVVRIKSNGHALGETLARRLRDDVDPYLVEVSLHGARAETHDRQTRVSGSFERLSRNVGEMLAVGLRVKMNATLTAWNEAEIPGMFAVADALGVPLQIDPEVTPRDDGDRTPLAIAASREGRLRLLRLEFERGEAAARRGAAGGAEKERETGPRTGAPPEVGGEAKHCGAGSSGIAIDPYGNVHPCVQWRRPVGNLHQASIREIWAASRGLDEVRSTTVAAKAVVAGHGAAGPLLNFCPGLAAAHGDALTVYPDAVERANLVAEVQEERKRIPLRVLPG
jgi:MoaA/NifB/PqqE/SkfB family radical SAM enzyme